MIGHARLLSNTHTHTCVCVHLCIHDHDAFACTCAKNVPAVIESCSSAMMLACQMLVCICACTRTCQCNQRMQLHELHPLDQHALHRRAHVCSTLTHRMYATAAARGDGLLLLCGGRDASGTPLGDAYGFARHRDGRWEWHAAPGAMPTGRYQHGAIFVGNRLHISGGAVGGGRMVGVLCPHACAAP